MPEGGGIDLEGGVAIRGSSSRGRQDTSSTNTSDKNLVHHAEHSRSLPKFDHPLDIFFAQTSEAFLSWFSFLNRSHTRSVCLCLRWSRRSRMHLVSSCVGFAATCVCSEKGCGATSRCGATSTNRRSLDLWGFGLWGLGVELSLSLSFSLLCVGYTSTTIAVVV